VKLEEKGERRTSKVGKYKTFPHFDVQCSTFDVRRSPFTLTYLQNHLKSAHAILSPPLTELSLALVGDKKMSDLHLQFLNIPGPTDVLTFPLETNAKDKPISGEVVICVPEARRRCRETGIELRKELLLYALHGMLHLCGFDDRTDRQFRRMHAMEDEILTRLGVGRVFDVHRDNGEAGGDD
jgi:probable rRNA maturation factor